MQTSTSAKYSIKVLLLFQINIFYLTLLDDGVFYGVEYVYIYSTYIHLLDGCENNIPLSKSVHTSLYTLKLKHTSEVTISKKNLVY